MNEQGATPLIVLTPINPKLRKFLDPLGWTRHQEVVDYIESLQGEYDFVFSTSPTSRLRTATRAFYDGVHMTPTTPQGIDYILKQTGGCGR